MRGRDIIVGLSGSQTHNLMNSNDGYSCIYVAKYVIVMRNTIPSKTQAGITDTNTDTLYKKREGKRD